MVETNVKIALLGPGQTFGEYDIFTQSQIYSTSLKCVSGHGEIYCLKAEDFTKRFKNGTE